MSHILLASTPVYGHVAPLLRIGEELVYRGHRVTMLTGTRFEAAVVDAGIAFTPLTGTADFDDRDQDSYIPDRNQYSGVRRAQYEIRRIFVDPIPEQARALRATIRHDAPYAVLVDGAFTGALPLITAGDADRPPIVALGVTPLSQSDPDLAPYGMGLPPARSAADRLRYRALGVVARHLIFRPTQRAARAAFAAAGSDLPFFAMDSSRAFDQFLQTGPDHLEYPRRTLASNTRFIGTIPPRPFTGELPDWWGDLDGRRPVIHVTQGTVDNGDTSRLIRPAIDALADTEYLLVVSTGGGDTRSLGTLPSNVRAAAFLPYDLLLPKCAAMITNGGYGGVQTALGHGVPIIVAGDTEEKPEVAARVAWSGAGIDLRTGTPTAQQLREATTRLLASDTYRRAALSLSEQQAQYDPFSAIESVLHPYPPAR